MKGSKMNVESRKSESKLAVKKTKPTKEKKARDPNLPKRPATAFFVFMEEFRKQYKEKHPENKKAAAVCRAGGISWKSLSEQEKAPYVTKADELKEGYDKAMLAYNRKLKGEEEESDKSKSKVHDEEEESDKSKSEVHDEEDVGTVDDDCVE